MSDLLCCVYSIVEKRRRNPVAPGAERGRPVMPRYIRAPLSTTFSTPVLYGLSLTESRIRVNTVLLHLAARIQAPVLYRLRHKDGSWRHFEAVRTNLLDDPAVRGIVINYRDATERLRAEEDLRGSEERHQRLAENSPETIFTNSAGAELADADGPEQLIGRPCLFRREGILGRWTSGSASG